LFENIIHNLIKGHGKFSLFVLKHNGYPIVSRGNHGRVKGDGPQKGQALGFGGFLPAAGTEEIDGLMAVRAFEPGHIFNNPQGFVADCMDCHLPAPHDTFDFFFAKTAHGIRDVVVHFLQEEYDRQKNREKAYASFKNEQCQKCHRNILYIPNKRGAMLAHRDVVYAKPGYEKRCVDCHRDLVHNPTPLYRYKQYQDSYRGLGL